MDTQRYIEALKRDIEDKFNHSFRSATDFDKLERLVRQNSNESLNASTLKRIWGYSKTQSKPRRTTLTVLANVLGFRDWESYVESQKQSECRVESGFIPNTVMNVSELTAGATISFRWNPNRRMTLRCRGKENFEVVEQENSSLRVGDTFRLTHIREGHPIYCKDVMRDARNLGDYIAGEYTGIHALQYSAEDGGA